MALSEKHRSSIYQKWCESLGEEEAQALLSQFPARDLDEPVTKEFVRAEIADVRTEAATFRGEVHAEFGRVRAEAAVFRAEVHAEFGSVRAEIAGLRAEMHEGFRGITMWMVGALIACSGVVAGIVTALA